jgi:hypothetical protein
MSIDVRRLNGEPIVYAHFTGYVSEQDILQMFRKSVELTQDVPGRVYRITEMNDIEMPFDEMLRILKRMGAASTPGATADARFTAVLVGNQEETYSLSENAAKSGMNVPLFENYDEALNYLRWQIHTEN